jgi:hypothetical protein
MAARALAADVRVRAMYDRNIQILNNYTTHDFSTWQPTAPLTYLAKPRDRATIVINGLNVYVLPTHIFSFKTSGAVKVGGIWFAARLVPFTYDELGMFAESIYLYLNTHYSTGHLVDPKHCRAVDILNRNEVLYADLLKGSVSSILNDTITDVKRFV